MPCCTASSRIPNTTRRAFATPISAAAFLADDNPNLPARDLHLCAQADRFDFALSAAHVDGHLQIQRSPASQEHPAAAHGLELRNGLKLQQPVNAQVCA
jgi:hypothetical protein